MRNDRGIEALEKLDQAISRASDVYEEAWTKQFENPSAENLEKLEVAGMLVEFATNRWLDALT